MTVLYTPFDSYFDAQGRPTMAGQHLLSRIASALSAVEGDVAGFRGLPDGGTAGQVLTKTTATDYDADWATLALSGSFEFDDGTASGGGGFILEDGGA
jgi:hypothetical protein